jgi:hypothetical protein
MPKKSETRGAGRSRASELVCSAADSSEDSGTPRPIQAQAASKPPKDPEPEPACMTSLRPIWSDDRKHLQGWEPGAPTSQYRKPLSRRTQRD